MASSNPAAPAPRLALLDGLRFLGAFLVLLFHMTAHRFAPWQQAGRDLWPDLHAFTRHGYLGVQLFFFISGFVILMTAWGKPLPVFFASRVSRLYPAYWVAVLSAGAMLIWVKPEWKKIHLDDWLVNLTMVQPARGVGHIDGAYWTLWAELRFYLIIGVFSLIGITRQRVVAFCFLWPIVAGVAQAAKFDFLAEMLIAEHSPYFAAGMILYLAHRNGWNMVLVLATLMNFLFAARQVSVYSLDNAGWVLLDASRWATISLLALMWGLVWAVTCTPLRQISWRWPVALGALSYPLYAIHETWGWYLIQTLPRGNEWLTLAVVVVVLLAAAWLINQFVEKPFAPPFRRAIVRALESMRQRDDADATSAKATAGSPPEPPATTSSAAP